MPLLMTTAQVRARARVPRVARPQARLLDGQMNNEVVINPMLRAMSGSGGGGQRQAHAQAQA